VEVRCGTGAEGVGDGWAAACSIMFYEASFRDGSFKDLVTKRKFKLDRLIIEFMSC